MNFIDMLGERDSLPEFLRGDGPCADCGTLDNVVWSTDSAFWNAVCRVSPDYQEPILCVPCFVKRAYAMGYRPTGWSVTPNWRWVRE